MSGGTKLSANSMGCSMMRRTVFGSLAVDRPGTRLGTGRRRERGCRYRVRRGVRLLHRDGWLHVNRHG